MNERITRFSTHSSSLISKSSVNFLYVLILFSLSFLCFLIERRRDSGILQCVSLNKLKSCFFIFNYFYFFFFIVDTSFTAVVCYTFYYIFTNVSDRLNVQSIIHSFTYVVFFLLCNIHISYYLSIFY